MHRIELCAVLGRWRVVCSLQNEPSQVGMVPMMTA